MKKTLMLFALLASGARAHAAFTVNLTAGQLFDSTASGGVPLQADGPNPHNGGSLLLLVAAGGDTGATAFSETLTAGQYVSGNDIVLAAGGFDMNAALNTTQTSFTNISTTNSGDLIALRWFPGITFAQYKTGTVTPSGLMSFGTYFPQINPLNSASATPLAPDGGSTWVVPSSGTLSLRFLTNDTVANGTQPVLEGFANFTVASVNVPEPSTYALLGLGFGGLVLCVMRQRQLRLKEQVR